MNFNIECAEPKRLFMMYACSNHIEVKVYVAKRLKSYLSI